MIYEYVDDTLQFFDAYLSGSPCNPGYPTSNSDIPLADTDWHHIVYAYDHPTHTWAGYKDGVQIFSKDCAFTLKTDSAALVLGGAEASLANGDLQLDEVALYNHSLSEAQVQAHYAARHCP